MLFIKLKSLSFLFRFTEKLNYENLKHYIHNHTKVRIKAYQENPELISRIIPDEKTPGFTYSESQVPYIFIDEAEAETVKTETLLHEFCHFIKHSYTFSYLEKPVKREELEAENFVYYVTSWHKFCFPMFYGFKKYSLIMLLFILLSISVINNHKITNNVQNQTTSAAEILLSNPEQKEISPQESSRPINIAENQTIESTVYITPTGKKYHLEHCGYLKENKIPISRADLPEKYSPCKVCKP